MKTILIIFDIALYGIGLFVTFRILIKDGDKMKAFLADIIHDYPIKGYYGIFLGVVLLIISIIAQLVFFLPSLLFWLFLLFGAPFFIFQIKKIRSFNVLLSTTVAITMCYGIILFASVDNVRDSIGYAVIPQYSVYYQTETVMVNYRELGDIDKERDIAYVRTGNDHLDFILTHIYPTTHRVSVFFLYILSMYFFISIKNRYYAKQQ